MEEVPRSAVKRFQCQCRQCRRIYGVGSVLELAGDSLSFRPLLYSCGRPTRTLDGMTRSAISLVLRAGPHWRAPRHRSAFSSAAICAWQNLRYCLSCCAPSSGAGCASVGGRGDSRFYPGVYPGVQNHVYYFAHPEENDMPSLWWLGVIDLPFSAALDTVLLPYWAIRRSSSTNEVYR